MGQRILFIGFKKQTNSILIGGGVANKRSLTLLQKRFGHENVDEIYILDDTRKRSLIDLLLSIIYTLFDYHNGLTPQIVKQIVHKANDYSHIFICNSVMGIIAKKLKENHYNGKIITHYHNIESIYYDAQMPSWLPGRQFVVRCAANNDKYGCEYSDKIMTLSQRDSNYLQKHYGRKADAIISVSVEDKFQVTDKQELTKKRPLCFFLGAYSKPNNEGVLFFVKNVLPYVDIEFKVVGRDMSRLKKENDCMKNIEVINNAPDLVPYFEAADFMILPVFSGSGMKIKTCESLMFGKNIIGSAESFEGYNVDPQKVGGLCNTAEEYIQCLQHYIDHPIPKFNSYSREIFLRYYSDVSTMAAFYSVFEQA